MVGVVAIFQQAKKGMIVLRENWLYTAVIVHAKLHVI
jgi:hypothetical protein